MSRERLSNPLQVASALGVGAEEGELGRHGKRTRRSEVSIYHSAPWWCCRGMHGKSRWQESAQLAVLAKGAKPKRAGRGQRK
jgi:hypothetical protein